MAGIEALKQTNLFVLRQIWNTFLHIVNALKPERKWSTCNIFYMHMTHCEQPFVNSLFYNLCDTMRFIFG